jgi:hypothetical protein
MGDAADVNTPQRLPANPARDKKLERCHSGRPSRSASETIELAQPGRHAVPTGEIQGHHFS